ncbi:hypothetical protein [Glutamicibacter sp. PS]|uniref:hypothetical protein n=1 Tax=Glutamicibacter sp. PS TaxID=3075634 RepID=UPI00284343DB|nr:hypothetical protein [Glutamicibacter sp. PS]MDR4533040.1 hypothetical protein [Glutamicibacter sp. PS]
MDRVPQTEPAASQSRTSTASPPAVVGSFASGTGRLSRGLAAVSSAAGAQATQSAAGFAVALLAAHTLGIEALGLFSILYGALILAAGITSGFVGDSLLVLDRHAAEIRAGLASWFAMLATAIVVAAFITGWLGGALSVGGALVFAAAAAAYIAEDLIRRNLMAVLAFHRIIWMDLLVLAVTLVVALGFLTAGYRGLIFILGAVTVGQLAGMLIGWYLLPRSERRGVHRPIAWGTVARYGIWRAALQALRPGQLTGARLLVTGALTLAAAGALEAARIYAAPAMLMVSGVCSYLFASLAARQEQSLATALAFTDRAVRYLLLAAVVCGALGMVLLPVAGELITGRQPVPLTVLGWLGYAMVVAVATPYGLLAAVRHRARAVFLIRALDSILSLGLVAVAAFVLREVSLVPWAAALGALVGGLCIRGLILMPLMRAEATTPAMAGDRP